MTTDRAAKLGHRLAAAVLAGESLNLDAATRAALEARIASQASELLLSIDWRVLPGDEQRVEEGQLFSGQMELL